MPERKLPVRSHAQSPLLVQKLGRRKVVLSPAIKPVDKPTMPHLNDVSSSLQLAATPCELVPVHAVACMSHMYARAFHTCVRVHLVDIADVDDLHTSKHAF